MGITLNIVLGLESEKSDLEPGLNKSWLVPGHEEGEDIFVEAAFSCNMKEGMLGMTMMISFTINYGDALGDDYDDELEHKGRDSKVFKLYYYEGGAVGVGDADVGVDVEPKLRGFAQWGGGGQHG